MEFHSSAPQAATKSLYPCLASITIAPPGSGPGDRTRRLSASSGHSGHLAPHGEEEEGTLKRIMSGGRRKSSFGAATGGGGAGGEGAPPMSTADRRKSIAPSAAFHAAGGGGGVIASGPEGVERGTWFWRVQAGVVGQNLVLLPLTQPANPLLTAPPQPLSQAMPSHNAKHADGSSHDDEGLVDKVKNLFRRGSTHPDKDHTHSTGGATADSTGAGAGGTATTAGGDKILDQTATGDQLPSSKANAAGADNVNANAETAWPGVIKGEKLQAIVVPLTQVDRHKVRISGGKRGEASWVTVPVTSHFAHMIQGHADGASAPKSGEIKFEFDKDWIGSKGEAELLHHHITSALSDRSPRPAQVQLGQGQGGHNFPVGAGAGTDVFSGSNANNTASATAATGTTGTAGTGTSPGAPVFDPATASSGTATGISGLGVTPDESVASGRKVAGET